MSDLLRADFYRIKKDIILLIALILLAAFALLTPFLYYVIEMVGGDSLAELEAIGMSLSFTGKYSFVSSLSITNNFGIVLPMLIGILVCRDFSAGTIKNKIISGHGKPAVYMSLFISAIATGALLFIIYALLTLASGSLILGYGAEFTSSELLYILKTLLMGTLIFSSMISLAVFFATTTRNTGVTIVLQIFASLFVTMLGTIPMLLPALPDWLEKLLRTNPAYQINSIASGTIPDNIFATSLISSAAYIVLAASAGALIFRKADQK